MTLHKRLKNLVVSLFTAVSLWTAPALAAGTTPLALVPQVDSSGAVASGCQLTFFVAGTPSQVQNSYFDFALTQPQPTPLQCDQSGRVPMHWLADGLVHIRLTDSAGSPLVDTTMQVLGPSSGGGGGGSTVDPTTLLATGDLKVKYGTGVLSGYVRANGLTIGNATCGCSERANADTQLLFIYLYNADPNLTVSGGRTGNALSDFNASKQLTLPDGRGLVLAGLDDMGNSGRGIFTGVAFSSGNATTLGSALGQARQTLATLNLPPYTPSGSVNSLGSLSTQQGTGAFGSLAGFTFNGPFANQGPVNLPVTVTSTFTGTAQGGTSTPFSVVQPTMLITIYMKL